MLQNVSQVNRHWLCPFLNHLCVPVLQPSRHVIPADHVMCHASAATNRAPGQLIQDPSAICLCNNWTKANLRRVKLGGDRQAPGVGVHPRDEVPTMPGSDRIAKPKVPSTKWLMTSCTMAWLHAMHHWLHEEACQH